MSAGSQANNAGKIEREVRWLELLGLIHSVAFPAAGVAAALSYALSNPFIFPATAIVGAVGVLLVNFLTKCRKDRLREQIESAEKEHVIPAPTAQDLRARLTRVSVAGPAG